MVWIRCTEGISAPDIIQSMSILPTAREAVREMNHRITFGASTLTRVQEEAIATVVSVANRCRY